MVCILPRKHPHHDIWVATIGVNDLVEFSYRGTVLLGLATAHADGKRYSADMVDHWLDISCAARQGSNVFDNQLSRHLCFYTLPH